MAHVFVKVTTDAGLGSPLNQNDDRSIISPDGSKIAFISGRPPANDDRPEVWVNTDGTGLHQITTHQNVQNLGESKALGVVWSPDSQKLLVHALRLDNDTNGNPTLFIGSLFTYNPDGTGESLFRRGVSVGSSMALDWSPDGRSILYPLIGGPSGSTFGYVILDALNPDKSSYLGGAQLDVAGSDNSGYAISGGFPGSVRFSPDGKKILYGDLTHRTLRTINLDGTNLTSIPAASDSDYFAKWWWPGAAIPQPHHLTLTPNAVTVFGTQTAQVTPTLYDINNNVIFHNADFYNTTTTGLFLCNDHPCTVGNNALFETHITSNGLVYNNNTTANGVLTLCGANAGFNTCTLVAVNFESIGVSTTTPLIRKSGADGAGVFNFTRRLNPNSTTSSSQFVPFVLTGAGINGTDYVLTDASGNRINGNVFTIPAGQNNFVIKVVPLITPSSGDKAVTLTIKTDDINYNYVADGLNTSTTVTIKDDHPELSALSLSFITPNKGGDTGSVSVTIYGANIRPGATAKLARNGQADITGTSVNVAPNGTSVTATFDLTDKPQGAWDVVVLNSDNKSATLPGGFTIEAGSTPTVWADLIGRYTMRSGFTQKFFIAYGNSGNIDAPPTMFRVSIPQGLTVASLPQLADGSTALALPEDGGTTLEFYVPGVAANSVSYLPFDVTASVAHVDLQIEIRTRTSPALKQTTDVQPDLTSTETVAVLDDTANHFKAVVHLSNASGSGDISDEITATDDTQARAASFETIRIGDTIQYIYKVSVAKSATNPLTEKNITRPLDNPGYKRITRIIQFDERKLIVDGKEVTASRWKANRLQLLQCLVNKGLIDPQSLGYPNLRDRAFGYSTVFLVTNAESKGPTILPKQAFAGFPDPFDYSLVEHFNHQHPNQLGPEAEALYQQKNTGGGNDKEILLLIMKKCDCNGGSSSNPSAKGIAAAASSKNLGAASSSRTPQARADLRGGVKGEQAATCFHATATYAYLHRNVHVEFSADPNDKVGPQGAGDKHYITGAPPLSYSISFENKPVATAPAQTIAITDQLDASKVDFSTFQLGPVSFGSHVVAPPVGLSQWTTDIDLRPANNLIVRVNAGLNKSSGLLQWAFSSIDPATGQPTTDPLAGFLPPNKTSPEGEGAVLFSVMPRQDLATGTEIRNQARIVFDLNAPIDTPEFLNTIDKTLPASHVQPLATSQSSVIFDVAWAGTDAASGVASYDVFVSENGGQFTLWLGATTDTSAQFAGRPATRYDFISLAHDAAGNLENTKTAADATTTTTSAFANSTDDPRFFARQHYLDFLSREPDTSGLNFWTNEITSCGTNLQCVEVKRINVSASFFLSIEFQETGYFTERIFRAAYGSGSGTSTLGGTHQLAVPVVRFSELLPDSQTLALGVIVGQGNWQQQLDDNKNAFTSEFVERSRFTTEFPASMTAAQFVDKLNANAGNPLSPSERTQLVGDLTANTRTRAQVLRAVIEDADFVNSEFNRAFVLMEYFGYLRRNPNDAPDTDYTGYDFWLTKLNQFNGNYINAEMVKAFISSIEYRQRFAP